MRRNVIYFIDEDEAARRANVRALCSLLDDPEIEVQEIEPSPAYASYLKLIARPNTVAFVLDQRMKGGGIVDYNGIDLARFIRGIDGKIPIYILTGHPDSTCDFEGSEHLVEYIIGKDEIEDPESIKAKIIKARMLRHMNVYNDVRDSQEQIFHDLLVKSLSSDLSADEQAEMNQIEGITTAPIAAAEREKERALGRHIDALKELLEKLPNK